MESNRRGPGSLGDLIGMMILSAIAQAGSIRERMKDEGEKKVGDKVCLVYPPVSAYMTKENGDKIFDVTNGVTEEMKEEMDKFATQVFTVVETNSDHTYNCGVCDEEHKADLKIGSWLTKEEYYIPSEMVKVMM